MRQYGVELSTSTEAQAAVPSQASAKEERKPAARNPRAKTSGKRQ